MNIQNPYDSPNDLGPRARVKPKRRPGRVEQRCFRIAYCVILFLLTVRFADATWRFWMGGDDRLQIPATLAICCGVTALSIRFSWARMATGLVTLLVCVSVVAQLTLSSRVRLEGRSFVIVTTAILGAAAIAFLLPWLGRSRRA